jgi:ABC-type transporter MlaC component
MRRLALTLFVLALAAFPSGLTADGTRPWGRLSPREIREGVRATVEGQLGALRAGRFEVAYEYAARGLRRQFTPAVFAEMIRRGYPALLAHQRAELALVRDNEAGRAVVDVTVFDARERPTRYRYQLVQERGGWRIEGVILVPPAARGDI